MRAPENRRDADGLVRLLLRVRGLQNDAPTQNWGLLRLLLLWRCPVPAKDTRELLLTYMTRRQIKWGIVAAAILVFAVVAAYQFSGGKDYSTNLSDLKSRFNADKGRPRLLVLLSPT